MGGVFSSKTTLSNCTSFMRRECLTTPQLWAIVEKGNRVDYYELFGFERYTNPEAEAVNRQARKLSLEFHPDKNRTVDADRQKFLTAIFVTVCDAKETFLDPKKKKRYDDYLKWAKGDMSCSEWLMFNGRLNGSIAVLVLGVVATFTAPGIMAAAGAGFAVSAGVNGSWSAWKDPEKPLPDFLLECCINGAVGAAVSVAGFHVVETAKAAHMAECLKSLPVTSCLPSAPHAAQLAEIAAEAACPVIRSKLGAKMTEACVLLGQLALTADSIGVRFEDPLSVRWRRSCYYTELVCEDIVGAEPLPMHRRVLEDLSWMYDRKTKAKVQQTAFPDIIRELSDYSAFESYSCIKAYTVESCLFYDMNECLSEDNPDLWCYSDFVHNLKRELKRKDDNNYYKDSHPLWRAAKVKEDSIGAMTTVGARFLIPSFVSTSQKRKIAESFMVGDKNALIEFDCSKNMGEQGYTYVKGISDISVCKREAEYLFYPYSGFEVTGAKMTKVNGLTVWHIKLKTMDTLLVEKSPGAAPREC